MRNKYPGTCCICGKHVPAEKGYFERNVHYKKLYGCNWFVRCKACVGKGAPWKQIEDKERER